MRVASMKRQGNIRAAGLKWGMVRERAVRVPEQPV